MGVADGGLPIGLSFHRLSSIVCSIVVHSLAGSTLHGDLIVLNFDPTLPATQLTHPVTPDPHGHRQSPRTRKAAIRCCHIRVM
jgi:hypothetical protein